jgi:hypothetical protein
MSGDDDDDNEVYHDCEYHDVNTLIENQSNNNNNNSIPQPMPRNGAQTGGIF